ncbi:riboflavin synthase [Rhodohalobacter halophilus]|uniref:riboflavin synthase n=1 Tax=Rhodohalobacter halophilus TaxID=1812810 RepID=UPI00083FD5D9|nr:riboflavin synthase [Rhodohalobacter halophilus]
MFTGIVSEVGNITELKKIRGGQEIAIECSFANDVHVDESIAINGVCHTVVSHNEKAFHVQSVEETLRKTNLGDLDEGSSVNLERSLTLDKAVEGHIVQGHVDTTGTIKKIEKDGADLLLTIEYPEEHRDYIVGRGSISLDGISLTIARNEGNQFTVAIIPYTWEETNLKGRKVGDRVNLEFDIFGKYIVQYLRNRENS